jgi:hypothetical protein
MTDSSCTPAFNVAGKAGWLFVLLVGVACRRTESFSPKLNINDMYTRQSNRMLRKGWLRDFFEPPTSSSTKSREVQYPELYPATYALNSAVVDDDFAEALVVRPLLKNTQLETRSLDLVYDAEENGWNPAAFHSAVDSKGAAVVLAETTDGLACGGYNPKGWASLGGARPSVAAFLFYETPTGGFQKLQKVGGGSLACTRDDGDFGLSFGPDGLIIPLRGGEERRASSKLGPYFERGPDELQSLFGGVTELVVLKVLVGKYEPGEDIPYSGGVLDCPGN